MTTTLTAPPPVPAPVSPARRALATAAALGTLPYVTLKVLWLAGEPVGWNDPSLLADPVLGVLNAVTLGMDLCVVLLAVALATRWGRGLPAWTVVLPAFVGTGFLVPMILIVVPAVAATVLSGSVAGDGTLEPWVGPVVYGGFAWQGAFLVAAFALYARDRWSDRLTGRPPADVLPLLRMLATGGGLTAVLAAVLQVAAGVADGGTAVAVQAGIALLGLAGALGVAALARGTVRPWTVAAAFTGSGVLFAWGLWSTTTLMAGPALREAEALPALAQLAALVAGFALAVAGLLALTRERPAPRG